MSEIEKIISIYIKEQLSPIIESSVKKAVKQALAEQSSSTSNSEEKFLDTQSSAQYIGDKLQTFYKRIHRKEIPRYGPPGRIFCKKADLDAFIGQKQSKSIHQIQAEAQEGLLSNPKRKGRRKAA